MYKYAIYDVTTGDCVSAFVVEQYLGEEADVEVKLIGRKKFYPVWCLDKWQNDTTNHIDCSKEATSTMPISRILTKTEPEYSLERTIITENLIIYYQYIKAKSLVLCANFVQIKTLPISRNTLQI